MFNSRPHHTFSHEVKFQEISRLSSLTWTITKWKKQLKKTAIREGLSCAEESAIDYMIVHFKTRVDLIATTIMW